MPFTTEFYPLKKAYQEIINAFNIVLHVYNKIRFFFHIQDYQLYFMIPLLLCQKKFKAI